MKSMQNETLMVQAWGTLVVILSMFVLILFFADNLKADEVSKVGAGRALATKVVKAGGLDVLLAQLKAERVCTPDLLIEGLKLGDEQAWACLNLKTDAIVVAASK